MDYISYATVAQAVTLYNNTTAILDGYQTITKQQFLDHMIDSGLDAMADILIRRYTAWRSKAKNKGDAYWKSVECTRYKPSEVRCCQNLLERRISKGTAR